MPIWHIHHPPSAFSASDKTSLSKAITAWYTDTVGLPAFYTIVIFHPHESENFFRGGEPVNPESAGHFIRIEMQHIAREPGVTNIPAAMKTQADFEAILNPFVKDRGYGYEYSYMNSPRAFWRVDGWVPPEAGSEGEKEWKERGRAGRYEGWDRHERKDGGKI